MNMIFRKQKLVDLCIDLILLTPLDKNSRATPDFRRMEKRRRENEEGKKFLSVFGWEFLWVENW